MQLYPTPENQAPPGAVVTKLEVSNGVFVRVMVARVPHPKGTVVFLNGRGDFIERYFETMGEFMDRGYAVAGFDWRGQGGSSRLLRNRLRGYVRRISNYEADLAAVMTKVVLPDCPQPYFAMAHSTGGHILLHALRKRTWFTKAVITAPLINLNYADWPPVVARILSSVVTAVGLGRLFLPGHRRGPMTRADFPGNPLTSDRRRFNRDMVTLDLAPELGIGGATYGWLHAIMVGIRQLQRLGSRDQFRCPIMVVTAGLDRVVDNDATRELATRVPGIALVNLRESQHEILMERDDIRSQFLAAFDSFMASPSR